MTEHSAGENGKPRSAALADYAYLSAIHAVDPSEEAELARLLESATPGERAEFDMTIVAVREALAAAAGVVETSPPPALRRSILGAIPGGATVIPIAARRRRVTRPVAWLAAALVAVSAVGAGTVYQLVRTQEQGIEQRATAPIAGGGTVVLTYQPGSKTAYARFENLPPSPAGHNYQMWHIAGSTPRSAGLVSDRDKQYAMENMRPGDRLAVTVESAAGAPAPTKRPIVVVSVPG